MKKIILFMLLMVVPFLNFNTKTQMYTPSIKYYANRSDSNNYLSSVTFEGVNFNFDKDILTYEIDVPYSKSTLGLTYTVEDSRAIVEVVGNEELYVGNNSLVIMVTSYDGSVREYGFTINRSEDNSLVSNDEQDILDGLTSDNFSQVTVSVGSGEGTSIVGDIIDVLKDNKKTLIYEWTDQNGDFVASLKIDGSKIENDETIDPNIKRNISNARLLEYIKDTTYTAISTINTNIPKNSIYTMNVSGSEDIYYLYFYEEDLLVSKPLRNIDGKIEFEIEGGYDYAIVGDSDKPLKVIDSFSWIIPTIIITVLIAVFIIVARKVMLKSVKDSYSDNKEVDESSKQDSE